MDAKELMKIARKARQMPMHRIRTLYRLQYRKRQLRLNLLRGTQRHICGSWCR